MKDLEYTQMILNKLVAIDPSAVLAGGSCRDMLAGVAPNDYDFYFYTAARTVQTVVRQFKALGIDVVRAERTMFGEQYAECNDYLRWVFNATVEGRACQFIVLSAIISVDTLMEQFPLSNSKAYLSAWDFNNIKTTQDFRIGQKLGCIFITNPKYSKDNPYIKKIEGRFGKVLSSKDEALDVFLGAES